MKTKIIVVESKDVGQRLDKWLLEIPEISSRSFAQDLIIKKFVLINNVAVKASHVLKINETVMISIPEVSPVGLVPFDFKLDILHEDSDLMVVNKPSGLVVHPAAGHHQDTLVNALIYYTSDLSMKNELRPGIVHRLDKETSGLLVIAKNDLTHADLARQFKNKTTHRVYYAVVEKDMNRNSGTFQSYLARHPVDRKRYASLHLKKTIITTYDSKVTEGKWAITHYKKIENIRLDKNLSLSYLQLKLETGRTHQIRVHLSENHNVLFGDLTYGSSKSYYKKYELNRFFLHAAELGFTHPRTKENMLFKACWPKADGIKLQEFGFAKSIPGI